MALTGPPDLSHKGQVAGECAVRSCQQDRIIALARDVMRLDPATAISMADIGCYNRTVYPSVSRWKDQVDFLGVDEDPKALRDLAEMGLPATDAAGYAATGPRDYSFALEVIEHIRVENAPGFLATIRDRTRRAIFMTTPNFEGWDGGPPDRLQIRPDWREMRYMPDHMRYFDADQPDPHNHKQVMTVDTLSAQLAATFPAPEWSFTVIKAWPWRLSDLARGTHFDHYFKLFALIWRPEAFPADLTPVVDAFCARPGRQPA
jgi:hypothetical protein